jgi:AraC-like DNA-binding protein
VAIELTPLGSRTLFGMPARELWDQSHELADVVGGRGAELWERLQGADTWDTRFQICDAVLERLASDHDNGVVAPELRFCWTTLVSTNGKVPVAALASEVGYSRQHLAQRFRDEFGLTPKLAGRIVRFEAARRMLQSLPSFVSTAQVATACGYYDQAHLYRDFAELAGCTPRELLGEELPNFQDSSTCGG